MANKLEIKRITLETLYAAVLIIVILLTLFPIAWSVGVSLRSDNSEILKYVSKLSWHTIIPEIFSLGSYRVLSVENHFLRPIINSGLVAILTVFLGFIVNGLAVFAFTKYKFRGQGVLFTVYFFCSCFHSR